MRRAFRRLCATAAAVAVLGPGAVSIAPAQGEPELSLDVSLFSVLRQDTTDSQEQPAFIVRPGERYVFRLHYEVEGAQSIRTGHTFAFEQVSTGRRVDVDSRTFDPEPPGRYTEQSARVVPRAWTPGVYRIVWDLRASAVEATSASERGTVVFLVGPPA
ncbi:MAG: hypothetical protein RIB67_06080 [Miltoncostaeaceae bacterium]